MKPVVLFIDFDGVLHPPGAVSLVDGELHAVNAFRWWPHLNDALKLLPEPVELVVHSTWRLMWEHDSELFAQLPAAMAARVKTVTPRWHSARQASIEAYCEQHGVKRFVVLDDEPQAFSSDWPGLVVCDGRTGISDENVQAALWRALLAQMTRASA